MKQGDIGASVQELQRLLGITCDGYFGPKTEAAVRTFQKTHRLVIDGIAGDKTLSVLQHGSVSNQYLTMPDIKHAADVLGVSEQIVLAVNEVESRGNGFLESGRIVILYERHIMYRQLDDAELDVGYYMERYPNLVNKARGGYMGGNAEHARLNNAKNIDESCALASCSYGLFQIMGFHWFALGYANVQNFVDYMSVSEGNQLNVFVQFVQNNPGMLKALKAKKWADFAKRYNGPAYKSNLYDVKLAQAYDQHANAA